MNADTIKTLITAKLSCSHCEVEGDGRHWFATLVSSEFEGLRTITRHQKVYQTVQEEMACDAIHALSLKTFTPTEWQTQSN